MTRKTIVLLAIMALVALAVLGTTLLVRLFSLSAFGPLRPEATALPADTHILARLDLAAIRGTATWRRLTQDASTKRQQPAPADAPAPPPTHALLKLLAGLERVAGLRLDRDVDEVIVAAGGAGGRPTWAVALLFGRFEADRILTALASGTSRCGPAAQTIDGTTGHLCTIPGQRDVTLAFPADGLAVVGAPSTVEGLLRSRQRGEKTLASNARLRGLLKRLPARPPFWLVVDDGDFTRPPQSPIRLPASVTPRALTVAGDPDGAIVVRAEMKDEPSATRLAQMVTGLIALARAQSSDGRSDPARAHAASALGQIQVGTERHVTRLTMSPSGTANLVAWLVEGLSGWISDRLPPDGSRATPPPRDE